MKKKDAFTNSGLNPSPQTIKFLLNFSKSIHAFTLKMGTVVVSKN